MLFIENISGFTQSEASSGTIDLNEKLLAVLDDYSPLSVRIRPRRWNEDWKSTAKYYHVMKLKYPSPEPFVIMVNAYSYGVGHGLVTFAKQLSRYNLSIELANLCDGVYWHWNPLGWWRALAGSRINLPYNIKAYHGFYQEKSTPYGVQPKGSECLSWTELFVEHEWMDDETDWHVHCIQTAKQLAEKFVGKRNIPTGAPESEATDRRTLR